MGKIWEILHKPETVVFFDIDGTLTSYNYGEHHAHHERDYTPEFRDVNIYADCKRLKPIYEYIKGHNINRLYCISREPHGHEAWKSEMVERLYGIPASHCFYTLDAGKKPQIVMDKVKELFPDIDPKSVVLMDDNDETLGLYMKETPFCTAHPMIFMENNENTMTIDEYIEYYRKNGYIKVMRERVGHAPIMTCACGVIIENSDGEILLQRRRDNGRWAIIGGSMEMGESFEEAVRRETKEEAGISLGKLDVFKLLSGRKRIIEYPNGDVTFGPGIIFITKEFEGEIVNDPEEVMEHRFFKHTQLPDELNKFDSDIILEWAAGKAALI